MKNHYAILLLLVVAYTAHAGDTFLYVVDVGPNRQAPWQVVRYDADGANPTAFITAELNRPQDIVFLDGENAALVSNLFGNRITRYDATTGAYLGDFATGIGQPSRMEIGPGNLLYVLQWAGNGRVLRYELDGTFVDQFTSVGVSSSIGLDWDTAGNLYVASYGAGQVRKFDSNGDDLGLFISSNLLGPTNIWFVENGDLMVLDWNAGAVKRFNSSGVFQGSVITGLSEPEGIEFLPNGDFLVANGGTSSVKQFRPDGTFVKDFVPAGLGGLVKPNALRFHTAPGFHINAGLNDAWFNPALAGQGLFVTVFPNLGSIFVAFFTYDVERPAPGVLADLGEPGHRWVTAFGPYEGNRAALDVELTQGGVFDSGDPAPTQSTGQGTITVEFTDCNALELVYEFPALGLSGTIPMTRIALDNVPQCEALDGVG